MHLQHRSSERPRPQSSVLDDDPHFVLAAAVGPITPAAANNSAQYSRRQDSTLDQIDQVLSFSSAKPPWNRPAKNSAISGTSCAQNSSIAITPASVTDYGTTIVIDGLDEATAETRATILGLMKDLVFTSKSSRTNARSIRLAVVGRRSLRSDMDFKRLEKNYFIEVSRTKNHNDINSYIRKRLQELEILRKMRKMKPNGLKSILTMGILMC